MELGLALAGALMGGKGHHGCNISCLGSVSLDCGYDGRCSEALPCLQVIRNLEGATLNAHKPKRSSSLMLAHITLHSQSLPWQI